MQNLVFAAMLVASLLGFASEVRALQEPRPIATDYRIRNVRFSPNEVYKFVGHYGYQSSIEFAADEVVETVSIGDSIAWMVDPAGDRLFLKPIEQDATTNMTVITNKHTYHFELYARETENIRDVDMVFVMRFSYPDDDYSDANLGFSEDDIPDFENEPEKYNFQYSIRGSNLISPIRIFDDGRFTYFEFPDKNADVPAFFHVDAVGNEELINFRTRGNFIVVERVSPVFTLRRGAYLVCVYNERMAHEPVPEGDSGSYLERLFN